MYNRIFNAFIRMKKEIKMTLIVNIAMILIGIFALLMFKYLDAKP